MTDEREPLRVGPLVLKWTTNRKDVNGAELRDAYECPLAGHGWVELHDDGNERGQVLVSHGGTRGVFYRFGPIERCLRAAEEHLTETGYLAQYRSRRRLLAKVMLVKADRDDWRAEHRESHHGDYDKAKFLRARATKYARWAERLRDV